MLRKARRSRYEALIQGTEVGQAFERSQKILDEGIGLRGNLYLHMSFPTITACFMVEKALKIRSSNELIGASGSNVPRSNLTELALSHSYQIIQAPHATQPPL
jgi:hypothetical protein